MLSLYRRLQVLRRSHAAPVQGTIENIAAHGDVLTYERRSESTTFHRAKHG